MRGCLSCRQVSDWVPTILGAVLGEAGARRVGQQVQARGFAWDGVGHWDDARRTLLRGRGGGGGGRGLAVCRRNTFVVGSYRMYELLMS